MLEANVSEANVSEANVSEANVLEARCPWTHQPGVFDHRMENSRQSPKSGRSWDMALRFHMAAHVAPLLSQTNPEQLFLKQINTFRGKFQI